MIKRKITYIGFSEEFVFLLLNHPLLELTTIITQEGRFSAKAIASFQEQGIKTRVITKKSEVSNITEWVENGHAIMYKFEFILPRECSQSYSICNVHTGNLITNRGAHPISWSVLNGDNSTCLSLYKIDHRIDLGLLIATYEIPIYDTDDTTSIELRLFEGMPYIIDEYIEFLNGKRKGKEIEHGAYHPRITRKDYTIDIDNDTMETIDRKIRSQKAYRGAVLEIGSYRFYVADAEAITKVGY